MKYRTDFVTNSSSSNFSVEITCIDTDNHWYEIAFPDEDLDHYKYNLTCSAKDLARASSFDDLARILSEGMKDCDGWKYRDDELVTCPDAVKEFCEMVEEKIGDFDRLETLMLTRTWDGYGEGCSCFFANAKDDCCGLYSRCVNVCHPDEDFSYLDEDDSCPDEDDSCSEETRKSRAKEKLSRFLQACDLQLMNAYGHHWPTGFLGEHPAVEIDLGLYYNDDLERFASDVTNGNVCSQIDHATETVIIYMKDKKISAFATYYPF